MLFTSCKTLKITGEYLDNPPSVVPKVALSTDLNRNNWQHLDPINDSVPGMSVDKAYTELIKDSEGQTVVVAVLDTGIDIISDGEMSKISYATYIKDRYNDESFDYEKSITLDWYKSLISSDPEVLS